MAAPAVWLLTTPLTGRVTEEVCGDVAPATFVTVTCSPSMMMANGKSPAAVVHTCDPAWVATDQDVAAVFTPVFSVDPALSKCDGPNCAVSYGSSGMPLTSACQYGPG